MEQKDREGRDAAGIGPYARERETLVPMSSLDSWTVSEGEPDIRGWEVRTVSGRQLGTVADLLVDADAGEVVLLDVDLPGTDNHTFVPIRLVQIDRTRRLVLMDSADLPESGMTRGSKGVVADRRADVGTVRYPRSDRQVEMARPSMADSMPAAHSSAVPLNDSAGERRRNERRRIERVNSEF
jgi:hypothetical protein